MNTGVSKTVSRAFIGFNITISYSSCQRKYYIIWLCQEYLKKTLPPLSLSTGSIGQNITRYRKARGLTQQQLASIIGIDQNIVSAYENGKLRLYDEMVARFALALKTTSDDLLGISKQDSENPEVSLRFLRRLAIIEGFPETQKKRILRNLDDAIEVNTKHSSADGSQTSINDVS